MWLYAGNDEKCQEPFAFLLIAIVKGLEMSPPRYCYFQLICLGFAGDTFCTPSTFSFLRGPLFYFLSLEFAFSQAVMKKGLSVVRRGKHGIKIACYI